MFLPRREPWGLPGDPPPLLGSDCFQFLLGDEWMQWSPLHVGSWHRACGRIGCGLYMELWYLDHINEHTEEQGKWIIDGYDLATVKIGCYFDGCFVFALRAI